MCCSSRSNVDLLGLGAFLPFPRTRRLRRGPETLIKFSSEPRLPHPVTPDLATKAVRCLLPAEPLSSATISLFLALADGSPVLALNARTAVGVPRGSVLDVLLASTVDGQMLSLAFRFLRAKTPEERALVDLETHYTKEYLEVAYVICHVLS
ncbi:hypothetical protein Zm00014a_020144 [Zea mays]|uniref:Uncharacterized protein n=1 Tax=Zea mays TaxID=4577 RepID=A0A3L6GAM7_MAIZE|nr:hypothetical protein Zm00014a_020144 [Zea mays]